MLPIELELSARKKKQFSKSIFSTNGLKPYLVCETNFFDQYRLFTNEINDNSIVPSGVGRYKTKGFVN